MGRVPEGRIHAKPAGWDRLSGEKERGMAVQTTAVITQRELQEAHDLQAEIAEKQARYEGMTENLKALLFSKAPIEPGRFDARLSFKRMHNVPWKQVVIE